MQHLTPSIVTDLPQYIVENEFKIPKSLDYEYTTLLQSKKDHNKNKYLKNIHLDLSFWFPCRKGVKVLVKDMKT